MYLTALIIDCAIARLYRHNGAMNKSLKLEPGTGIKLATKTTRGLC